AGDAVRVTTRRSAIVLPALVVSTIRPDTLFIPYHWGRPVEANELTIARFDPQSWIPNYKACAARIERTDEPLPAPSPTPVPSGRRSDRPEEAAVAQPSAGFWSMAEMIQRSHQRRGGERR